MKSPEEENSTETESGFVVVWSCGEIGGKMGYAVSFWSDEDVLKLIKAMLTRLWEYTKTTLNGQIVQYVNYISVELFKKKFLR